MLLEPFPPGGAEFSQECSLLISVMAEVINSQMPTLDMLARKLYGCLCSL